MQDAMQEALGCDPLASPAVDVNGSRILLTGASGGLGKAIARRLAANGAELVLSGRREQELVELARSMTGGPTRHAVIVADLTVEGAAERLVSEAGRLDILVANAALPASGRIESFSQGQIERAIMVNLESPIRMSRELVPTLIERGEGHLVFISSLGGRYAPARSAVYSATKFGLRGYALALREDLHSKGVGVSVISPGLVRDAGMYADTGARMPPGMGTTTSNKVARAVARAISRDRSEIVVAPLFQRVFANFAGLFPELAGRVTRADAIQALAERVTDRQLDKR